MTHPLESSEVQAFLGDVLARSNILFVTGCGRSGTNLIQRCLSTVHDPVYYWGENDLSVIHEQRRIDGSNIVLKRRAGSHATFALIPPQVKIVHIVRDPAAVLTSRVRTRAGYYIQPERWLAEYAGFTALRARHPAENLAVVRYEDLMEDADAVQARLERHLGVNFDLPFSRHTERNHLDGKIDKVTGLPRVWSNIEPERWRLSRQPGEGAQRMREIRDQLEPALSAFKREFGYSDAS